MQDWGLGITFRLRVTGYGLRVTAIIDLKFMSIFNVNKIPLLFKESLPRTLSGGGEVGVVLLFWFQKL